MIQYKILAPHEGGRDQKQSTNDYRTGIWRVYFYDSSFDEVKEAYIDRMDLYFKAKKDNKNIEATEVTKVMANYLNDWAEKYLQDKKFEDIKNYFIIKL